MKINKVVDGAIVTLKLSCGEVILLKGPKEY
jgi:hypothetical protein